MNAANSCQLQGTIQSFGLYDDNWTRYNRQARGQIRFWLGLPRELAGGGIDVVLCAIEPRTAEELRDFQDQLLGGRAIRLCASARSLVAEMPGESTPGVIFVAESCEFESSPAATPPAKHTRATGKMAAAADDTELAFPGGDQ